MRNFLQQSEGPETQPLESQNGIWKQYLCQGED